MKVNSKDLNTRAGFLFRKGTPGEVGYMPDEEVIAKLEDMNLRIQDLLSGIPPELYAWWNTEKFNE